MYGYCENLNVNHFLEQKALATGQQGTECSCYCIMMAFQQDETDARFGVNPSDEGNDDFEDKESRDNDEI